MTAIAQSSVIANQRTRSYFFEIALTSAGGVLFMAAIDTAARFGYAWAADFFWLGILLIFVPPVLGMLMLDLSRDERLLLVVLTGLALYFVKVLHSPGYFTLHDELLHWKTADTILQSHHLFTENPLLPVSPLFPGLHLATASFAQLLEIDVYTAGVLLLALMRLVFMIAVFVLLEQASGSPRVAGLGTLIYMGNSNFVFFASQYAYKSVALPAAVLLICVVVRRNAYTRGLRRLLINLVAIMLVLVVVATHHVTAYMTVFFLLSSLAVVVLEPFINGVVRLLERVIKPSAFYSRLIVHFIPAVEKSPVASETLTKQVYAWTGVFVAVSAIAWMMYVATPTVRYLSPIFTEAINELVSILQREGEARVLFSNTSGAVHPLWERLITIGAVLLTAFLLPYGMLEVWRKYRGQMIAMTMTVAAVVYFGSQGFRFTEKGWEISNRSSEFLFIGIGLIGALGALSLFRRWQNQLWRSLLLTVMVTVIFIGGFQAGWTYWARVPGTYMVGADTRSIEAEGISAADWTAVHFAPNTRMIADRINGLLMGAFGRQYVIRSGTDNIQTAPVLFTRHLSNYEYMLLNITRTDYVVVDYRLTRGIPELGVFVEFGEQGTLQHREPLSVESLQKFDLLPDVSRVFDSGNIVIFDVREIRDASAQP